MQTKDFIDRASQADTVDNSDTARRVALATIEALCLYLPPQQTYQMAAQLPRELADAAQAGRQQAKSRPAQVALDDFYHEVAVRAQMQSEAVPDPVRAVIDTLKKAVTDGELADVAFDLPPEINTLLAS